MKVATSSASFAGLIASGELTQLEWLDLCANELEVDGVVFDAAQFPRLDGEYLAQLKKLAADLGLTIAAVAAEAFGAEGASWLDVALSLGAPVLVSRADPVTGDAGAWPAFARAAKARAGEAKRSNVTLAVRNAPGTLCASADDLRRLAKDVDSAWLRFAPAPAAFGSSEDTQALLGKAVIAVHVVEDLERFASPGDLTAGALNRALARFRGFVVIESGARSDSRTAYHEALERFVAYRSYALVSAAVI